MSNEQSASIWRDFRRRDPAGAYPGPAVGPLPVQADDEGGVVWEAVAERKWSLMQRKQERSTACRAPIPFPSSFR
jgi:hypothetical protein